MGDSLVSKDAFCVLIKTQVQIPRNQVKSQRHMSRGGRDRWVPGACWPAILAKVVNFQGNEKHYVKAIRLGDSDDAQCSPLVSSCAHIDVLVCTTPPHTHTHNTQSHHITYTSHTHISHTSHMKNAHHTQTHTYHTQNTHISHTQHITHITHFTHKYHSHIT